MGSLFKIRNKIEITKNALKLNFLLPLLSICHFFFNFQINNKSNDYDILIEQNKS